MLLKRRTQSDELRTLRHLDTRMELTEKEKQHYLNLEKGYEGEVKFDLLAESLEEERYIINDLLLEVNNSYFQIDSLIISQGVIHLIDVKNFYGDWYLESNKLFSVTSSREYKNPLDQLNRSSTLMRQLLQSLKQNFLIDASLIFINPEFTLYHAPLDTPIIYPTQLNRFISDLNNTPTKLNDAHKKLAQTLISLHQPKNPFTQLPKFHYDQLQKGVYCAHCRSFRVSVVKHNFVCGVCGVHEKIEPAILRNVEEFRLLFPERMVTTQAICDWCKVNLNKKTIGRILKRNYTSYGSTSDTYFI